MDSLNQQLAQWFPHIKWSQLGQETLNTLYMALTAGMLACLIGLVFGVALFIASRTQQPLIMASYRLLSGLITLFRSIPFIILIILLFPLTKWLMGTILGVNAALPALVISASAFYSRLVELALREVDKGVLEASHAMGANPLTLISKVLLPESSPALIAGLTVTLISLVGGSAIAGAIGAGGLGNLAYLEGFQRSHFDVVWLATLMILLIVFVIQLLGDRLVGYIDKR